jgi:hypothetical protein
MTEPSKEAVEHELKCWPPFFDVLALGIKTFEYRKDDRGYRAGDTLRLREFNPFEEPPAYTGREIERRITYVLGSNALASIPTGYVVMSLADPEAQARNRWEQEVRERLGAIRKELCFCPKPDEENQEVCDNCGTLGYVESEIFGEAEPVGEEESCDGSGYITRAAKLKDDEGNVTQLETVCPGCPRCQSGADPDTSFGIERSDGQWYIGAADKKMIWAYPTQKIPAGFQSEEDAEQRAQRMRVASDLYEYRVKPRRLAG